VKSDLAAVYPDQPVRRGIDELHRFRDAGSRRKPQRSEPERFFELDDERVLVPVRGASSGHPSNVLVEAPPVRQFTIRDSVLVRFKVYLDRAEALAAAGLSD
jgi:hypothetical protein